MQKYDVRFYTLLVKISVFLRLLLGPTIFLFPRLTALVSFILDWIDGELYKRAGYSHHQYGLYDKGLDFYWYCWIILYVVVNHIHYQAVFIALFILRTIGQVLFFFTRKRILFFIFPNIFEIFFLYYLTVTFFNPNSLYLYPPYILVAFSGIIIFVLIREYLLHIHNINMSNFFAGKMTYWPKITSNTYKAFGFVLFLFVFSFSYLSIYQQKNLLYKTRANKISKNGAIISYQSTGLLSGWIDLTKETTYQASLFNNGRLINPICNKVIHVKQRIDNKRSLFLFEDLCLKTLINGKYYLLFRELNLNKECLFEFNLKDGKLTIE